MQNTLVQVSYKLPGGGYYLNNTQINNVFIVSQKRIGFSDSIFCCTKEVL